MTQTNTPEWFELKSTSVPLIRERKQHNIGVVIDLKLPLLVNIIFPCMGSSFGVLDWTS
jgi:hypothetical protein